MYLPKKTVILIAAIVLLTVTLSGCINLTPPVLPTLTITKTGDEWVPEREEGVYEITVTVTDAPATNVIVIDTVPPQMFFEDSEPYHDLIVDNEVTWELGNLEEGIYFIDVILIMGDDSGPWTNTVSVTCDEGSYAEASLVIHIDPP